MAIKQVKIGGTLYTYIGPKPGINPGIIQYDDNGTATDIKLSDVDEVVMV